MSDVVSNMMTVWEVLLSIRNEEDFMWFGSLLFKIMYGVCGNRIQFYFVMQWLYKADKYDSRLALLVKKCLCNLASRRSLCYDVSGIKKLTDDCLSYVFSFLKGFELNKMSKMSKHWNRIARKKDSYNNESFVISCAANHLCQVWKKLKIYDDNFFVNVRSLKLSLKFTWHMYVERSDDKFISDLFPNISKLEIEWKSNEAKFLNIPVINCDIIGYFRKLKYLVCGSDVIDCKYLNKYQKEKHKLNMNISYNFYVPVFGGKFGQQEVWNHLELGCFSVVDRIIEFFDGSFKGIGCFDGLVMYGVDFSKNYLSRYLLAYDIRHLILFSKFSNANRSEEFVERYSHSICLNSLESLVLVFRCFSTMDYVYDVNYFSLLNLYNSLNLKFLMIKFKIEDAFFCKYKFDHKIWMLANKLLFSRKLLYFKVILFSYCDYYLANYIKQFFSFLLDENVLLPWCITFVIDYDGLDRDLQVDFNSIDIFLTKNEKRLSNRRVFCVMIVSLVDFSDSCDCDVGILRDLAKLYITRKRLIYSMHSKVWYFDKTNKESILSELKCCVDLKNICHFNKLGCDW